MGNDHDDPLFDENGILREEHARTSKPAHAYLVFLQRFDARFDVDALEQRALRFFHTKIGLMAPKRYRAAAPIVDLGRFALALAEPARVSDDVPPNAVRAVFARPATSHDHDAALSFEFERQATGLGGLARRCSVVAEVERSSDDDGWALLLAAIFASTHLGPIVDVASHDIFGVKTARVRLARHFTM